MARSEHPGETIEADDRGTGSGHERVEQPSDGPDPTGDERANYDYAGSDVERPGLVDDLDGLVDGEVRFDDYTKQLYATDASAYEVTPIGVVFPTSTADVAAAVEYCAEREIPVLPRGGGTSLAGQSVNEAVVLDFTQCSRSTPRAGSAGFSPAPSSPR